MTDPSSSPSPSPDSTAPLYHASSFVALLLSNPSYSTYDTLFLKHLRLVSATLSSPSLTTTAAAAAATTVTARLTVTTEMCNAMGRLHGGATATIFDLVTTLAIVVARRQPRRHPSSSSTTDRDGDGDGEEEEGNWVTAGVSRTLNVSYLEGVGVGEEVEIVAEMVKMGKRLAHVRGVMRRVGSEGGVGGGGEVVATCEHGKVNVDRPVDSDKASIGGGGRRGGGEGGRGNKSKL